jgi:diacylglycerol kinase (ATP)
VVVRPWATAIVGQRVPPPVAIIVNPISGSLGRTMGARARAEMALALAARRGLGAEVFVTERQGHARELAAAALARGVNRVIAWGGDGTVNEVASALVRRDAVLGVIPSGSGNGLARELRLPLDPTRAFEVLCTGRECRIDAGELEQRLFFNVAGIGLDARVAHRFAEVGAGRRGLRRYLETALRELVTYRSAVYEVATHGSLVRVSALLIALANGRQYGNGARIAPAALVNDGRLDVVVIADRSLLAIVGQAPKLFSGRIAHAPGVTCVTAADVGITSERRNECHVDGEPFIGGPTVTARCHPGVLRILVPAGQSIEVLGSSEVK